MKKTAFLINTSRGQIIYERDLIKALKNKWISGAALDVYEKEPISSSNPLLRMKNVIILPHIGSATYQVYSDISTKVITFMESIQTSFLTQVVSRFEDTS
jgi:phosphoglycerate dehydrogenase-like enzyme